MQPNDNSNASRLFLTREASRITLTAQLRRSLDVANIVNLPVDKSSII
jgi:hypothetical protein